MAVFSNGGTTSPDILYIVFLATTCMVSSLLNPLVFIHNFKKTKKSPAFSAQLDTYMDIKISKRLKTLR